MPNDTLFFDIEADSKDSDKANLKFFGGLDLYRNKYFLYSYEQKEEILNLLSKYKNLIGFNINNYDIPVIKRYLDNNEVFDYKVIVDLWYIAKSKLKTMGYGKLKDYKLSTILKELKLGELKGEIDYNIFKQDSWDEDKLKEIFKYLKQDLVLNKVLFEFFEKNYRPLKPLLSQKAQDNLLYVKATDSKIAYEILCNQSNTKAIYLTDKEAKELKDKDENEVDVKGGHRILARKNLVKGNIVQIDITSAYPHALMMGNLFSPSKDKDAWDGGTYFNLKGKYNNRRLGKKEQTIKKVFVERLEAKQNKDLAKDRSYKLIINGSFGITAYPNYKSIYNKVTASDCTCISRTIIKKLAKTIEENGFYCIYGFTDGIYTLIPEGSNKEELMFIVNEFIEEVKTHVPFPLETFKLNIDEEIKLFYIISNNNYLTVRIDDTLKLTGGSIINKNTPEVVINTFNDYIKPKIIKELDVNFTEKELTEILIDRLKQDISLCSYSFNVKSIEEYNTASSIQSQISKLYGEGEHQLIPINSDLNIGVGMSTKYCDLKDFKKNKLDTDSINIKKLMTMLKPFIRKSEQRKLIP